jgi:hypothetical protein
LSISRSNGAACRVAAHNSSSASPVVRTCSSPSSPRSCSSTPLIVCEWLRSRLSASRRIAASVRIERRRRGLMSPNVPWRFFGVAWR